MVVTRHMAVRQKPDRAAFIAYWKDDKSSGKMMRLLLFFLAGFVLVGFIAHRVDAEGRYWWFSLVLVLAYIALFSFLSIRWVNRRVVPFIRCPRCGDWFGQDVFRAFHGPNPKCEIVIETGRCVKCGEQILADG